MFAPALWWTALLVLTALGGAGLAVAADRPQNSDQRPEVTWRADQRAFAWIDALAADEQAILARAVDLSAAGRDLLSNLQTLDIDAARASLDAGDAANADISALVTSTRERVMAADASVERWRVGRLTADALDHLAAAAEASEGLPFFWAGMAVPARAVADLIATLREHDEIVFQATTAGRESHWQDALDLLGQAAISWSSATALRAQLAEHGAVETLEDLLSRMAVYDAALTDLYTHLRDGGEQSGQRFNELQAAVEAALAALPSDQGVFIVIVFEAVGALLIDGLVAMEEIHGTINDALQAVTDLKTGGPQPLEPEVGSPAPEDTLPPEDTPRPDASPAP
jgi:hypothetical protein